MSDDTARLIHRNIINILIALGLFANAVVFVKLFIGTGAVEQAISCRDIGGVRVQIVGSNGYACIKPEAMHRGGPN